MARPKTKLELQEQVDEFEARIEEIATVLVDRRSLDVSEGRGNRGTRIRRRGQRCRGVSHNEDRRKGEARDRECPGFGAVSS